MHLPPLVGLCELLGLWELLGLGELLGLCELLGRDDGAGPSYALTCRNGRHVLSAYLLQYCTWNRHANIVLIAANIHNTEELHQLGGSSSCCSITLARYALLQHMLWTSEAMHFCQHANGTALLATWLSQACMTQANNHWCAFGCQSYLCSTC